ncbi:MAG TPA: aminoglycoside phosphotransferase family protein [Chryseolinea sp.]|nr:aminoglycoside phosphotransferase family protein [Chryseolinea sp.]
MLTSILRRYDIVEFEAQPLVSGLINRTWKVAASSGDYILQRVNNQVFRDPWKLAENLHRLDHFLKDRHPDYLFVAPIPDCEGKDMVVIDGDGYFRLLPYVQGSHTISVVASPQQAYEAAAQFGRFTKLLSSFEAGDLHLTIPDFHNLTLRYEQFEHALATGNALRISDSRELIDELRKRQGIVQKFSQIRQTTAARVRVMHHDTKISNVLFDHDNKGMCVIDLDTVMPGYFISDVGDMMRTYLSPASEEVTEMNQIEIREDFFRAIVQGYLSAMQNELTPYEKELFCYSGFFLIYMQALRFLTDHLNNDLYYGAAYEGHNYFRALNQLTLLKRFEEKLPLLEAIVREEIMRKRG